MNRTIVLALQALQVPPVQRREEPVRLYTRQQESFFRQMGKSRLCHTPSCLGEFFKNPHLAIDFCQAYRKYLLNACRDRPGEIVRSNRIQNRIRQQLLGLSPDDLAVFADVALTAFDGKRIDPQSALIPFCTVSLGQEREALAVFEKLVDALLAEDVLVNIMLRAPVLYLMTLLILDQLYTHTWDYVAQAVADQAVAGERILRKLTLFMWFLGTKPRFVSNYQFPEDKRQGKLSERVMAMWTRRSCAEHELNLFPVHEGTAFHCNHFFASIKQEQQSHCAGLKAVASNWLEKKEYLQTLAQARWNEITTDARYPLNDWGDLVLIEDPLLTTLGFRRMILRPNDSAPFPQAVAHVFFEPLASGRTFKVIRCIDDPILDGSRVRGTDGRWGNDEEWILKFAAIHALWLICMGKENGHEAASVKGNGSGNGSYQRRPPRSHFMKIPGRRPSQEAIQNALDKMRQEPPIGKTFYLTKAKGPVLVTPSHPTVVLRPGFFEA